MYHIYFKRANGGKFEVWANVFLKSIDDFTTRYIDRNHLLASINRVDSLPLDLSEKAYIWKQTEDENIDLGEVLYSDSADIADVDVNKENILKRFNNKEHMSSFLQKYLEISYGKGANEEIGKKARRILELLNENKDLLFPFINEYFEDLIDVITNDYEAYRFAYLANKAIPKKKVKCITKNIVGKRERH